MWLISAAEDQIFAHMFDNPINNILMNFVSKTL